MVGLGFWASGSCCDSCGWGVQVSPLSSEASPSAPDGRTPSSPYIRSGQRPRTKFPCALGERVGLRSDGTNLQKRLVKPGADTVTHRLRTAARDRLGPRRLRLEDGAGGHQSGLEIAPQRDHQLARQRDDHLALERALGGADAREEPL